MLLSNLKLSMKMKQSFRIKLSIIVFVACGLGIFYGCKKSDLDLTPNGPTELDYFANEAEFNKAVLGVYAKMSDFFWYNAGQFNTPMPVFLLPGDDITTNNNNEELEQFGQINPGSGRINYLYARHYQLINRANTLLEKLNGPESSVYKTPNLKNYNTGEALFLRGYAYYNLWNFFGTAPLSNERVTTSSQFFPAGTTGTQMLDQAIDDFTKAAALLPPTWDAANRGRATANSANGMLGKSLVFKGSITKNAADFSAALTALNKITGASLVPNFGDNFAWDTENNAESLFEYQATQPAFDNVWLDNDFDNPIGSMSVFWGYYDNNFALFGASRFFVTQKLADAFTTGDPRIASTFDPADRTVRKYVARDKLSQSNVGSINNYRILRYADVVLLKAEALIQSNGSTAEAIGLINQVRARARAMAPAGTVPADRSTAETNRTTIMDWIMTERLLELAGEGQRWFDLRRWHLQGLITLNNAFFSSNTNAMSFQAKHLYFPIPNSEIDVNPNVKQNPGY
jgi:tetratricopeptide (TPR) repeat protein